MALFNERNQAANAAHDSLWLMQHAASNVWVDPSADTSITMALARLSDPAGDIYGTLVSDYSIKLPIEGNWFQVYQLGNISNNQMGIGDILTDTWINLADLINKYGAAFKVYDGSGRLYPFNLSWIRRLPNNNVIIALCVERHQIDLTTEKMYLSTYNGYVRWSSNFTEDMKSSVTCRTVNSQVEIENVVKLYTAEKAKTGFVQGYVNGVAVPELTLDLIELYDTVEFYRDGLVKAAHQFNLIDLVTFDSIVDKTRKYLIHPDKQNNDLNFYNDIEIHYFNGDEGRFFPVHTSQALRQVTHNDYSISARDLQELLTLLEWPSLDNLQLRLTIRHSGIKRELVHESRMLRELYKLTDDRIVKAMVGIDSTISEWQAANLENSEYVRTMSSRYTSINKPECTGLFGYNATAKYISDSPIMPDENGDFTLPPLLHGEVTVFEYGEDGLLLGSHLTVKASQNEYLPSNVDCTYIEPIISRGHQHGSIVYDPTHVEIGTGITYRFFKCIKGQGGEPTGEFIDITGTDDYSVSSSGEISWNLGENFFRAIVSDKDFLYQHHKLYLNQGELRFSAVASLPGAHPKPLFYNPKVVDVFVGPYSLVPEVDYHIDWPLIVIYAKERIHECVVDGLVPISVRALGVSEEPYVAPKPGFVVDGILSNDYRFDLLDSKVNRIVIDGRIHHRSEVIVQEDNTVRTSHENGLPYVINKTFVPLRNLVSESVYSLIDKDEDMANRVENYLSVFKPQRPSVEHNPIVGRYRIFSPIMNKVIHDLIAGILRPVVDDNGYMTTTTFDTIMRPYIHLLDCDPIRNKVDLRYVVVEPHCYVNVIELSPIQFSIVERLNDRYLGNSIVLNKLLTVKG